jgi:hypothetical protein
MIKRFTACILFSLLICCLAACSGDLSIGSASSTGGSTGSGGPGGTTTGPASLSWNAVTTYTDGSPLTPAGYRIYYGRSPANYAKSVDVPIASLADPDAPDFTIRNLPSGVYYFVVAVYDADGNVSTLSNEASKVIP